MDEIKSWAITVSAVSIISGVISSLLPDNTYKKLFRFVAGTVLIYTFMQPLMGRNTIGFHIDDYLKDNYEVSENIDKFAQGAMLDSAEKAIEDMFTDFAKNNKTDCKVRCKCQVKDNNISIDEIRIIDCYPKETAELIRGFAIDSGFDVNLLIFIGD